VTFWNKVQQGVGRAAAEAEKTARIARIQVQMGEAEGTIRRKKSELGDLAYDLVREGKLVEPAFDPIVADVAAQETRLTELRSQLAEVQAPAPGATPT
jgi:hypothetical protein